MKKFFTKKIVGYVVASTVLGALALGTFAAVDTVTHRLDRSGQSVTIMKPM